MTDVKFHHIVFIVLAIVLYIGVQSIFNLSDQQMDVVFFRVVCIFGAIGIIYACTVDGKMPKPDGFAAKIWFYLGVFISIIGLVLVTGNVTGVMPTFPYAGFCTMSLGSFVIAAASGLFDENKQRVQNVTTPRNHSQSVPVSDNIKINTEADRKIDPLVKVRIGAKDVLQQLLSTLSLEPKLQIETVLSALGSLAGYACQASVRAEYILIKGKDESQVFNIIVSGEDGKNYYFGEALDNLLIKNPFSILVGAKYTVRGLGARDQIDINNIIQHAHMSAGFKDFGIPRISTQHMPTKLPEEFVKLMWPRLFPIVKRFCREPLDWPILYTFAIQEYLLTTKGAIDPALALSIVMESAVPMTRIDVISPTYTFKKV